jgi:hypothetical protein
MMIPAMASASEEPNRKANNDPRLVPQYKSWSCIKRRLANSKSWKALILSCHFLSQWFRFILVFKHEHFWADTNSTYLVLCIKGLRAKCSFSKIGSWGKVMIVGILKSGHHRQQQLTASNEPRGVSRIFYLEKVTPTVASFT